MNEMELLNRTQKSQSEKLVAQYQATLRFSRLSAKACCGLLSCGGRMTPSRRAQSIDRGIGARIRERRKELGMSQTYLAGAIGLSFQQMQKYENGANRIACSTLMLLAPVLGMPVSWFLSGTADVQNAETGPLHQSKGSAIKSGLRAPAPIPLRAQTGSESEKDRAKKRRMTGTSQKR